ncbi:DUF1499 domain-containing protein [Sphingomonas sp. GCM10030256]|uniref:DUF1499 domain-containing protein n=1 Tax=Sphingomonas sp. GCM10030256 TaxID=3273427 RepID=UPI00361F48EA
MRRQERSGAGAGLAWLALALAVGAISGALLAGLGTGEGWWSYASGLYALRYLFFMALVGAVVGLIARFRRKEGQMLAVGAVLLGLLFAAYLGNYYRIAGSVPAIHDASTDLADPPQFQTLKLRADNLDKVPDMGRPGWAQLGPLERWRAVHSEAYGDLRTVRLPVAPAEALRRAEQLARSRGWQIAAVDPAAGRLEATATTRFFRFKDDVVVRIRPAPGGGSIVDVRSVSRVGVSDLGENARRIRRFLADLTA